MATYTAYHGGKNRLDRFDLSWLGKGAGHNQEGPGFYFSTASQDALTYAVANKGWFHTVKLTPRKLTPASGRVPAAQVQALIQAAPGWQGTLLNTWDVDGDGEYSPKLLDRAVRSTIQFTSSPQEAFQQVWGDFYPRADSWPTYLSTLIRFGYDGHTATRGGGAVHFIMYNPAAIQVVSAVPWDHVTPAHESLALPGGGLTHRPGSPRLTEVRPFASLVQRIAGAIQ